MRKILFGFASLLLILCANGAQARVGVTDWYIQDFETKITVNQDSSLDIVEKITADCGNAYGKHGIFRILPQDVKIGGKAVKTPVHLISITDFNGAPLQYSTSTNTGDDTVTWKIGDPNKTVQGVNYYEIHYTVGNAIRFANANFDELYWNLNGNFWDLETDKFHADIIFPTEVTKDSTQISYYTGSLGSKDTSLATYVWSKPNVLSFDSTGPLGVRQGITVSVTFPKNIFVPYQFGFLDLYGQYFFLLIPLAIFTICFVVWWKYGKDPRVSKAIIPEYDAPGKLSPIELGMLKNNGQFSNSLVTAEIINFATKGLLTITETHEKILFFDNKDHELKKIDNPKVEETLNPAQKEIFDAIFPGTQTRKLSELKNSFYKKLPDIKKAGESLLKSKGLIKTTGLHIAIGLRVLSGVFFWLTFVSFGNNAVLGASMLISTIIILIFSFIMPQRTKAGAELNWEVKGFKMFMETVDKDRAAFYEKENIFEKFLPFAIVFGITGLWVKKMQEIYGADYYATHAPIWYAGSVGSFDAESFSSSMEGLSAAIAANTSAPSGSGGGGGAGGGGGGGGGGGW